MIDYMHPMVLLQTNIGLEQENIRKSQEYLEIHQDRLNKLFEDTLLYKELKEQYISAALDYIDEDETHVKVTFCEPGTRGLGVKTLLFNTQEIEDKLK
jgi:hypothetical protein